MTAIILGAVALISTIWATLATAQSIVSLRGESRANRLRDEILRANEDTVETIGKLQKQIKLEKQGRHVAQKMYRELVERVASGDAVIDLESELQALRNLRNDNGDSNGDS